VADEQKPDTPKLDREMALLTIGEKRIDLDREIEANSFENIALSELRAFICDLVPLIGNTSELHNPLQDHEVLVKAIETALIKALGAIGRKADSTFM